MHRNLIKNNRMFASANCEKCGLDPAIMAAPLITTLVDTGTIFVYFTIVTRIFIYNDSRQLSSVITACLCIVLKKRHETLLYTKYVCVIIQICEKMERWKGVFKSWDLLM